MFVLGGRDVFLWGSFVRFLVWVSCFIFGGTLFVFGGCDVRFWGSVFWGLRCLFLGAVMFVFGGHFVRFWGPQVIISNNQTVVPRQIAKLACFLELGLLCGLLFSVFCEVENN